MNRKIKSGNEIEKEIELLFETYKDDNILANKIIAYLKSITGKELIEPVEIASIMFQNILRCDAQFNRKLYTIKKLQKVFPDLITVAKIYNKKDDPDSEFYISKSKKPKKSSETELSETRKYSRLPFDILNTCTGFEKYKNPELENAFSLALEENEPLNKLFIFLVENYDVGDLINTYLYDSKRYFLASLVLHKIVPLTSILMYFDRGMTIKENTEYFYNLLSKKISRLTIQNAIQDNLQRIKDGKYAIDLFVI